MPARCTRRRRPPPDCPPLRDPRRREEHGERGGQGRGAEKDAGKDAGKKQTSAASDDASDPTSHALSGPTPEDDGTDAATDPSTGGENTDDGTGTPDESLQPRVLDDLGDSAFLDDLLTRAGSTAQHRTVKVVFRTSNVIVTVEYAEQPTVSTMVPDSKELQEKAQALARKLVEKFSE